MNKFIESEHCVSRVHCGTCLTSENWRISIQSTFEWDGKCPLELTVEDLPKSTLSKKPPCLTKLCRLGDMECEKYHSCRDKCMVKNKRITAMDSCPKMMNQMEDL